MSQVKERKGNVILAFPGMGKSPLARRNSKYLDLDFGLYREFNKVSKEEESSLIPQFTQMAKYFTTLGYTVMTNEPKIIGNIPVSHVYLPIDLSRSAAKMGVEESVVNDWVQGWDKVAKEHNIPVTYLKVGLDHYLS